MASTRSVRLIVQVDGPIARWAAVNPPDAAPWRWR